MKSNFESSRIYKKKKRRKKMYGDWLLTLRVFYIVVIAHLLRSANPAGPCIQPATVTAMVTTIKPKAKQ